MTYISSFISHQTRHASFKRIHRDSQETKPYRVENDTKTVNIGFYLSMGLMVTTNTANNKKPSKTTLKHLKLSETIRNHPKPSKTTQNFLQATTNYPKFYISIRKSILVTYSINNLLCKSMPNLHQ